MKYYAEIDDGNIYEYDNLNQLLNFLCYSYNDTNDALMEDDYNNFSVSEKLKFIKEHCPAIWKIYSNRGEGYIYYRGQ